MKRVLAGTREEILRRKQLREEAVSRKKAADDEAYARYSQAERAQTAPIVEELEYNLNKFSGLVFNVRVQRGYLGSVEVRVECNEREKFNDDVALAWSYTATLDREGNVQLESSSWSGLKATTPAQLRSLQQTVKAIEYLQSLDWERLLNVTLPSYSDYMPEHVDVPEDEDWNALLTAADLEDFVGKDILVKVAGWADSGYGNFNRGYIQIIKDSGSQFTVKTVPSYYAEGSKADLEDFLNRMSTVRVKKSKVRPFRTASGDLITVEF